MNQGDINTVCRQLSKELMSRCVELGMGAEHTRHILAFSQRLKKRPILYVNRNQTPARVEVFLPDNFFPVEV